MLKSVLKHTFLFDFKYRTEDKSKSKSKKGIVRANGQKNKLLFVLLSN